MLSICTVLLATFGVSEIPEPAFSVNASAVEVASTLDTPTINLPNVFGSVCVLFILNAVSFVLVTDIFVPGVTFTSSVAPPQLVNLITMSPSPSVALLNP